MDKCEVDNIMKRFPLCNCDLVKQPTAMLDYATEKCYGIKIKSDGSSSDNSRCGYYRVLKDGVVVDEKKIQESAKAIK